eukprot:scaffold6652_cov62-Phaeocystis_antarctica.AAC.6
MARTRVRVRMRVGVGKSSLALARGRQRRESGSQRADAREATRGATQKPSPELARLPAVLLPVVLAVLGILLARLHACLLALVFLGRRQRRWGRERSLVKGGSLTEEHGQPLRRDRDGVVDLRQLARHTGLGHVREEGGAKGGGDADEDERPEARSVILRRLLGAVRQRRPGGPATGDDRAHVSDLCEVIGSWSSTWLEAGQEAWARAQVGMAMQDGLATQVSTAAQDRTAPQVGTAA